MPPISARSFFSNKLAAILTVVLTITSVIAAAASWRWPWTNDAQVFHYIVFLIGKGYAPYREIVDLNPPGSYLSEWVGMHLAENTDLSYRLYDLLVLLGFGTAAVSIAKRYHWFAGVFAAGLFALIHISEGAWMMGERDLVMAVLLAGAYAFAFSAVERQSPWRMLIAFVLIGFACSIKPFALPFCFTLLPLCLLALSDRNSHDRRIRLASATAALAGLLLVGLCFLVLLASTHSIGALLHRSTALGKSYNQLNRSSLRYMLSHVAPRCLYFFIPPALYLAWKNRSWRDWRVLSLQCAVAWSLLSYFIQDKGFIYHRYPFVAFALLWIAIECALALQADGPISQSVSARWLALAVLACGSFVAAPFYLSRVFSMPHGNTFALSLEGDLRELRLRIPGIQLNGSTQCLDGITGCYSALYRLQLLPSTGYMGDQLLFQVQSLPAVLDSRRDFLHQVQDHPPTIFVETNYWYGGPQHFDEKLATWTEFSEWLRRNYKQVKQRTFPQSALDRDPIGYRIYARKDLTGITSLPEQTYKRP